jgi:hypothetical protein
MNVITRHPIGFRDRWLDFWTRPASPLPLAALRIGVAAVLLAQAFWVAPHLGALYGGQGILQGALADYVRTSDLPQVASFVRLFARLGIGEDPVLAGLGGLYVVGLVGLLLGWRTRLAGAIAWAGHLVFAGGHITSYGIDSFAGILLFYLLWSPCAGVWSLDSRAGRADGAPSRDARIMLRLVQIHLCIAYLACGLEKGSGIQWWDGEAIWRSVMMPEYAQYDLAWLSHYPWLAKVSAWGTLVVEGGYALFIWLPRTRPWWVLAIVGLHLGILFLMGLTLFALFMMVLSLAVFAVPAEPARRLAVAGIPAAGRWAVA